MMWAHGVLAVAWFIAAIPICIYLASSIPFLVFISVYAVVTGHWSSWQSTRVEVQQQRELENPVEERVVKTIVEETTVEAAS